MIHPLRRLERLPRHNGPEVGVLAALHAVKLHPWIGRVQLQSGWPGDRRGGAGGWGFRQRFDANLRTLYHPFLRHR